MPQGLQVWDENENLSIDLTDRLTKVLGIFSTGTTVGIKTIPVVPNTNFWFTCIPDANTNNIKALGPSVKYSNGTLSWDWGGVNNDPNNSSIIFPGTVIYGVY